MSHIIFAPICERCGHEFTKFEYFLGCTLVCPECSALIDNIKIINYATLLKPNREGEWIVDYSKEEYY